MGANVPINSNYVSIPRNPIIATDNRFVYPHQINLYLQEKIYSWTGDDFAITDFNGVPFFRCGGRAFSFREKKVINDIYGIPIFNIKHELLSLRGRFKIYQGDQSFRILASVDPISTFGSIHSVSFYNLATCQNDYLEIASDFLGSRCGIFHGNAKAGAPLICRINKQYDAKNYFFDKQNYVVEIAPNVDAAFMIGLGIIFDELKNDSSD